MKKKNKEAIFKTLPWPFGPYPSGCGGVSYMAHGFFQRRAVYQWPYGKEIHQYSAQYRVDPFLAVAVIKNESGFNPDAESKTGALGLMQIMPETGSWIAKSTDFPNFKAKMLMLPELNIKFGCWYLSELESEFQGNEILMLAAYNAGRGTVKEWMAENGWGFGFSDISAIPFPIRGNMCERSFMTVSVMPNSTTP